MEKKRKKEKISLPTFYAVSMNYPTRNHFQRKKLVRETFSPSPPPTSIETCVVQLPLILTPLSSLSLSLDLRKEGTEDARKRGRERERKREKRDKERHEEKRIGHPVKDHFIHTTDAFLSPTRTTKNGQSTRRERK